MAKVKPFKAVIPTIDKAHLVASRSYVTYTHEVLRDKLANNPFTFLHIIHPEGPQEDSIENRLDKYHLVRKKYEDFLAKGFFRSCASEGFYIYQQIKDGHLFTGVIAGTSIEDYQNNVIKKHEHTITAREHMFKEYLQTIRINAEPVLMSYPDQPEVEEIIASNTSVRPEFDFTSTDEIRHRFWLVDNQDDIKALIAAFEKVDSFYIADGHHRSASSSLLGFEEKSDSPRSTDYFMSYLLPESHLQIFDFNRLIKDLNGLTENEFLQEIKKSFYVEELDDTLCEPQKIHNMSMYLNGKWFSLTCKAEVVKTHDPVANLDAEILSKTVLAPILNITDLKTDQRVNFLGGLEGMEGLKKQVDSGKYQVAFGLYPVSINHLKEVADANLYMPPKSTWIEPKLRSGLIIYPL